MVMEIVKYGHPVLRQKGATIAATDAAIHKLADDMLETMYAVNGVGLAAQQVNRALQICVVDITGADRPSTLVFAGLAVDPSAFMPMVLINPKISPKGADVIGQEGCLSFPGMYGNVIRKEMVEVEALDREGNPLKFLCSGLLARAIQHEVDHLNGVLFIDHMVLKDRTALKKHIRELQKQTMIELGLES